MNFEKDPVWGTNARRRTLAHTRRLPEPMPAPEETRVGFAEQSPVHPVIDASAFGPEAHVRAQQMAYENMTRIQQESPYVVTEVVEHVVHDQRLYLGMWIVAGVAAVCAFLTFSPAMLLVAAIAVFFALYSTPGRQRKSE